MDPGRRDIAQGLVWTQLIVFFPESVKLSLLDHESVGGRPCRFRLEFTVHAFMPAILLWVSRIRVYRLYAKLEKPDRQKGKPGYGTDVAEWRSIVSRSVSFCLF